MPKKLLICLDTDPQPSVFDSVVAVDAGAEHLLRHGGVTPQAVRDLVYGAIFTRAPEDLKHTAIFVGGGDVAAGEKVLEEVVNTFFGPMRVSAMLDSGGANTTAAAAVLAAGAHVDLSQATVAVLAATGSVGKRAVRLLAEEGATVRLGSRSMEHAERVAESARQVTPGSRIESVATADESGLRQMLEGANVVLASGPPGVQLLPRQLRAEFPQLEVAIDLNAVPPLGIEGIKAGDKKVSQQGTVCYGALGVGGMKMKIHRAAIASLFESNDQVLDAAEIFRLGKQIAAR